MNKALYDAKKAQQKALKRVTDFYTRCTEANIGDKIQVRDKDGNIKTFKRIKN